MITALFSGPLPVLSWALTYAVHSTVLLSAVWLICRGLGGRALWLQDSLWKMALLGGILTATVQTGAGYRPLAGRIPLGATATVSNERALAEAPRELPVLSRPSVAVAMATTATAVLPEAPLPELPRSAEPSAGPKSALSSFAVPWVWLSVGLSGLGLAIAATLLGRRGWALWQLQARLAGRTPVTDPELLAMVETLRQAGSLRRPVRLSSGPYLTVPLAMGLWRPEICLPRRALSELSREQQRVVLAHEMAHLLRRDPTWLLLCRVVESVLFFQPLNRLAGQRLQVLSEYLCDDWSVGLTGRMLVFARCLTEVAGWVVEDGPALLPCMARPGSELSRRIGRLLEQQRSPWTTTRPRWLSPALGCVLVAVAACAPRVCQVASASPLPSSQMQPFDAEHTENQYLVAAADPAPRAPVVRGEQNRPSGAASAVAKPDKVAKSRPRPPQPSVPPAPPLAPLAPEPPEAPEAPEPPEALEPPAQPFARAFPAAPHAPAAPALPVPPVAPVPPAAPARPVAPAVPAPPTPPAPWGADWALSPELNRLTAEQARLAQEMTPSPELLAQLNEKSTALAQAIERHDQEAQHRLQRELAELSTRMRPSPEALQRLHEVSRLIGRQGRQLARLDSAHAEHEQQALHDHLGEAAERAHEDAARQWAAQSSRASAEGARDQAKLTAERARIEHEMARLEQDRARLNEQLQHLNAESRPR